MGYGRLTIRQKVFVSVHVKGRTVWDLGAGDLELSRLLLTLGAKTVHAVDKTEIVPHHARRQKGLSFNCAYFHELPKRSMDVLFVSWPINHDVNLVPHVKRAKTVIYLGKNTDGQMCGTPDFFQALIQRELLGYAPDKHNSLVIVGKKMGSPRKPTGEELAGMNIQTDFYSFDNAEACARGEERETRYPAW